MSETAIETVVEPTALARADDAGLSIETLVARVEKIKEVQSRVMVDGRHYGKIPGVDRPTLLQPGAQMLAMTFQFAPTFKLEEHRDGVHLEVVAKCTLTHSPTGNVVGEGLGSCTTNESRYRYRKGERTCPDCGAAALLKSKHEPEWFCWAKKGGCGAKFDLQDRRITAQEVGRIENPDIADTYNTVRKMATKRALVAAVLVTTAASDLFCQDVEDDSTEAATPEPPPAARPEATANTDLFLQISEAIVTASTVNDLTDAAKLLQEVREHRSLPPEPFKRLRAAWAKKRDELERSPANEDAEYEDVERAAISGNV